MNRALLKALLILSTAIAATQFGFSGIADKRAYAQDKPADNSAPRDALRVIQQHDRKLVTLDRRSLPVDAPVHSGSNCLVNGGFSDGLTGWTWSQSGGSVFPGAVTAESGQALVTEGDSFLVTLRQTFTSSMGSEILSFDLFVIPGFDTTADFIPDAFEASLLDAVNAPVVPTWHPLATSFFNIQEDGTTNLGSGTTWDGQTVTLDVSDVPAGTVVTVFFDFIGGDSDTAGGVRIDNVAVTPLVFPDCQPNGIPDLCEINDCTGDPACQDCQPNGVPDGCELPGNDCNNNGVPDDCDACTAALCSDMNCDNFRDDNCLWVNCALGSCQGLNTLFADFGGPNGDCMPDGSADANDKFHALNCFSDTNFGSPGEYPCEPDGPVSVYNVDAGGPNLSCCPDSACDANDAFAALNAFSGTSLCTTCPQDTAICVGGDKPGIPCGSDASCPGGSCVIQNPASHPCPPGGPSPISIRSPVGHATITATSNARIAQPGELIPVDVFIDNAQRDLRGYQLHLSVTGGLRGRLDLVDITVRDRADHVFAATGYFDAFNARMGQMIAGLDGGGVATRKHGYLATYTYRVSNDASGTFVVDVLGFAPANPENRTFLFASGNGTITLDDTNPAIIAVRRRQ